MSATTIKINDQGFTGYLATPASGSGAGILLIQEIFGVNHHIRSVADLYADAGFTVLAPDVFWRQQPGVQLGYDEEGMQKGMAIAKQLDQKQVVADLKTAADKLRAQKEFKGKLGTVGYCMGGTYAYLLATNDAVDVAVSYYGGGVGNNLDQAANLHCPIMLHFGAKDKHIPLSEVEKIKQALAPHVHVEVFVYDADHGFNCDERATYDRLAAMLAFARTMILLSKNLA